MTLLDFSFLRGTGEDVMPCLLPEGYDAQFGHIKTHVGLCCHECLGLSRVAWLPRRSFRHPRPSGGCYHSKLFGCIRGAELADLFAWCEFLSNKVI